jgi:hypothetical protein
VNATNERSIFWRPHDRDGREAVATPYRRWDKLRDGALMNTMTKSATDVMQEIVFSAVIDSILALKSASKGMPNTLLRDLNAVHANTTFADLPKELQATIAASVRAAFTRLLKEGYAVSNVDAAPQRSGPSNRDPSGPRRPPRDGGRNRFPNPRR